MLVDAQVAQFMVGSHGVQTVKEVLNEPSLQSEQWVAPVTSTVQVSQLEMAISQATQAPPAPINCREVALQTQLPFVSRLYGEVQPLQTELVHEEQYVSTVVHAVHPPNPSEKYPALQILQDEQSTGGVETKQSKHILPEAVKQSGQIGSNVPSLAAEG